MGIVIFEKNKIDLDMGSGITITVTDSTPLVDVGASLTPLLRNRKNDSGWGTTGSSDAGNTEILVENSDQMQLTDLILTRHNFKNYTAKYWDGFAFVDFSIPIAVSNNTLTTTAHHFGEIFTTKYKIIITGTMNVDDEKYLSQIISTNRMGEFTTEPYVKKPKQDKGRKVRKMLSGRANITRTIGSFSCSLSFPSMKDVNDWALAELMFDSFDGFLVWLCGGTTNQFFTQIQGWRLEDIYLCQCANDLDTEWTQGRFVNGQSLEIQLNESRT